jgi:hypothetical protein
LRTGDLSAQVSLDRDGQLCEVASVDDPPELARGFEHARRAPVRNRFPSVLRAVTHVGVDDNAIERTAELIPEALGPLAKS